jgi:hypothetical protein
MLTGNAEVHVVVKYQTGLLEGPAICDLLSAALLSSAGARLPGATGEVLKITLYERRPGGADETHVYHSADLLDNLAQEEDEGASAFLFRDDLNEPLETP